MFIELYSSKKTHRLIWDGFILAGIACGYFVEAES
jgi:hypothetical protein